MTQFGTLPDGTPVTAFEIARGQMRMILLDHGARLQSLFIEGIEDSLSLPSPNAASLASDALWNGPVIGPVLNRIGGASAEIAGQNYTFTPNEGVNLLHSGAGSTDSMTWTSEPSEDGVRFRCSLADGYGGFPGNRQITATYAMTEDGFTLDIEATTDSPTLMHVGHHPNWTLGGGVLSLGIDADRYLPINDQTLPTGEIANVEGTAFDFRTPRVPPPTIDHNFCLVPGGGASLQNDRVRMAVETDAPGIQVFTGKTGVAIEPQLWPDAPNNPAFPSILLSAGDVFRQHNRYRFELL